MGPKQQEREIQDSVGRDQPVGWSPGREHGLETCLQGEVRAAGHIRASPAERCLQSHGSGWQHQGKEWGKEQKIKS